MPNNEQPESTPEVIVVSETQPDPVVVVITDDDLADQIADLQADEPKD